ncbi:uncharacterized protein LOC119958339 isoform X2 [Scyliorhinus canicula]|uniref:uncharacterized protein LOC119958339 isoform X2 n=1 Tax=Scyliorhinus canicula TaxID=7830 RepID=UPI0018F781B3|nr:uncharacterized protein LOC119958339 isoform X2 [Scyliorhinus canicula]
MCRHFDQEMEDTDNAGKTDDGVSDCVTASHATPSQGSRSPPEEEASLGPARAGAEEVPSNRDLAMAEGSGDRAGNRSWDCPDSVSSESDEYTSDLDSVLSDEELSERHDYLRSLLRIIGEPPPFQYYTEFENAMNSPGVKSSFSFLHAGGGGEPVHDQYAALSSSKDKSSTFNSTEEAGTSSSGNASQYRKVEHSGVVAPFSHRTLSHPSFHSFYAAVSSQQSHSFPAAVDDSGFENQEFIDSHSKPDRTVKSEASILRSQDIHMPVIHPCEFFYTDPLLPSGYRVYNHLSLPTRQVLQGLRLNTPSPIMSACVAPNIQPENHTPSGRAPHSLNSYQEQRSPISEAERDAISTLLDLSQCDQLDNTGTQALQVAQNSTCTHQTPDVQDAKTIGVNLPANSGGSGINDNADTNRTPLPFLNHWSNSPFESSQNTELNKVWHIAEPCEHSSWQQDPTPTSPKSDGRPTSTSSEAESKTLDSAKSCAGRESVDFVDAVPEVAQEIETE